MVTEPGPLLDEQTHRGPHPQDFPGDFRAFLTAQMNRAQAMRLKNSAEEAYQPEQFRSDLTSDEATLHIEALKAEIALAESF